MIGVSDFPEEPTASLYFPNLKQTSKQSLVAEIIMEAIQILPESKRSATFKNRSLFFLILEAKFPWASTSEFLFKIDSLGIRT